MKLFKFIKDRKYNISHDIMLICIKFKKIEYSLIYGLNRHYLRYNIREVKKGYTLNHGKEFLKVY